MPPPTCHEDGEPVARPGKRSSAYNGPKAPQVERCYLHLAIPIPLSLPYCLYDIDQ